MAACMYDPYSRLVLPSCRVRRCSGRSGGMPTLPVLVLTAKDDTGNQGADFLRLGRTTITKPFAFAERRAA